MTNIKITSTLNLNSFFFIALFCVVFFASCEQENLNELVTNDTNQITTNKIDDSALANAEIVQMDMNAINEKINATSEIEDRSIRTSIFSETYSIDQGQWFGVYMNRAGLSAAHKYIAVITPQNGDPELIVYGYNPDNQKFRHVRNGIKLDKGMEEVQFTVADFPAEEARNYFYTYGVTATTFNIEIFVEKTYNGSLNETEVNGRNVNFIKFTNSAGEFKGTFIQREVEKLWEEEGTQQGATRYSFQEVGRDDWSVYLRDDSRGVNIQIDLHTKKVMYSDDTNGERRYLYTVTERYAKTNGWVASQVKFGYGAETLGAFVQYSDGIWVEEGAAAGTERFRFKETGRDEWSVYLHDASRKANVQLDLSTKKVLYQDEYYTSPVVIYLIEDAI